MKQSLYYREQVYEKATQYSQNKAKERIYTAAFNIFFYQNKVSCMYISLRILLNNYLVTILHFSSILATVNLHLM